MHKILEYLTPITLTIYFILFKSISHLLCFPKLQVIFSTLKEAAFEFERILRMILAIFNRLQSILRKVTLVILERNQLPLRLFPLFKRW